MRIIDAIDDAVITQLCERHEFFWLDVTGPTVEQVERLGAVLGLHALAVDDSIRFGQRPKLDTYADTALLVLHGGVESQPEDENPHPLEEIHCYISGDYIVTLHRAPYPALDTLKTLVGHVSASRSEQYYVYKVIDAVVDSFFPILADLDEEINDLEDAIVAGAGQRQLEEIFRLKRVLMQLRKAVVPMRDVFAREAEAIADLAGLEADSHDYFRDVYDHLIRITGRAGLLPRDGRQLHRLVSVHGRQPAGRDLQTAHGDRLDLPALELPDRILRDELRLGRRASSQWRMDLHRAWPRHDGCRGRRDVVVVPTQRLDQR